MDIAFVAIRLLLAVILIAAGVGKLADPAGARRAFTALGGPSSLGWVGAWLLPIGELAAAIALLSEGFAAAGSVAALSLFTVFTVVLATAVARGSPADCHCFGQLGSAPASRRAVIRTSVLAGLAALLVVAESAAAPPAVAHWFLAAATGDLLSSALLVATVAAFTRLMVWTRASRQRETDLLERIETLERHDGAHPVRTVETPPTLAPDAGLPIGAAAPWLTAQPNPGQPVLIVFVSESCPPCDKLVPGLAHWQERLAGAANLMLVSREDAEGKALAEAVRARWTPAGVVVNAAGRVASPLRYGIDGVQELFAALNDSIREGNMDEHTLHHRLGSRLGTTKIVVGDAAPVMELVDAAGGRHARLAGEETLLVFWDPSCTYCQGMTRELQAIEATRPTGAPRMIFVIPRTAASASASQAIFSSPSIVDPASATASLFGARGTPSAVLVDRHGKIASTVATGRDAVLSLLVPVAAGRPTR